MNLTPTGNLIVDVILALVVSVLGSTGVWKFLSDRQQNKQQAKVDESKVLNDSVRLAMEALKQSLGFLKDRVKELGDENKSVCKDLEEIRVLFSECKASLESRIGELNKVTAQLKELILMQQVNVNRDRIEAVEKSIADSQSKGSSGHVEVVVQGLQGEQGAMGVTGAVGPGGDLR